MVLQTQHYSSCLIRFLFYIQWLEFSGINAEIINGQLFNVNSGRKIQSDYVIDVTSASSRMQCALRCQRRSECAGINFNFQSKQCEICSVPGDPTYIEASSGWDVTTPCGLVSTNGLEVSTAMGRKYKKINTVSPTLRYSDDCSDQSQALLKTLLQMGKKSLNNNISFYCTRFQKKSLHFVYADFPSPIMLNVHVFGTKIKIRTCTL